MSHGLKPAHPGFFSGPRATDYFYCPVIESEHYIHVCYPSASVELDSGSGRMDIKEILEGNTGRMLMF